VVLLVEDRKGHRQHRKNEVLEPVKREGLLAQRASPSPRRASEMGGTNRTVAVIVGASSLFHADP